MLFIHRIIYRLKTDEYEYGAILYFGLLIAITLVLSTLLSSMIFSAIIALIILDLCRNFLSNRIIGYIVLIVSLIWGLGMYQQFLMGQLYGLIELVIAGGIIWLAYALGHGFGKPSDNESPGVPTPSNDDGSQTGYGNTDKFVGHHTTYEGKTYPVFEYTIYDPRGTYYDEERYYYIDSDGRKHYISRANID